MEWLFRRHFWIVHLAFLALTAIILAGAVNVYLEYWLTQTPVSQDSSTQRSRRKALRNFTIANERNLFAAKRDRPKSPQPSSGSCDEWWDSVQSSLQIRLVSTAVFNDPFDSLALVQDTRRGGKAETYSISECPSNQRPDDTFTKIFGSSAIAPFAPCNKISGGGTVKRIETNCVYFYNPSSGQCEYVAMGPAVCDSSGALARPVSPPSSQGRSTPKPSGANGLGESIKKTGTNSFQIDGSDLDNILNNLSKIFTGARAVPKKDGGKDVIQFVTIKPDSVFAKIGFKNGDILTNINGYEMSADKAAQLLQNLRSDTAFNVQGKRDGASFSYEYNIKR